MDERDKIVMAAAPAVRPTDPVGAEGLPARHRFLLQLPGEGRLVSATVHVGKLPPPGEGWAVLDLPALGLQVALKLEA